MANYTVKNETVTGYHVSSGVSVLFSSDGIASKCTVSSGGWLAIGNRGAADDTTVSNGGYMSFGSGSYLCSGVAVKSGGTMAIGCNTQIKNAVADNGAVLHLTMAGEWFNRPSIYELTSNGVSITSTTKTSTTDIGIVVRGFTGWDMKTPGCSLLITDWASAAYVKVSSGCALVLGSAVPYGPGCAGQIDVYNGGTAWLDKANGVGLATVHSGGTMYLTDVENATIMENGGYLKVYDERIFEADEYYDPNVKIKPNTFSKVVLSGTSGKYAQATAHSGTTAVSTTIGNSGWMEIFDGGKATDTVVSSGGVLHVFSGAVVRNVNLATSGDVFVSSGGKVTGSVKLDGRLFCEEGAILDFDISGLSPNNTVLVTNCSNIATYGIYPTFSLTVSASQVKGTYKLAANAYLFGNVNKDEKEKTLVICDTSGARIGSVISGKKTMVNGQTYALHLSGGDLSITVAAYVEGEELWYEQFGCADNGWNDYLVNKSKDLNPNAAKFVSTTVTVSTTDILLDTKNTVSKNGKKNYVGGGGDAADFAKITMKSAAKLSLAISATDAAKFTLWRLIPGKGDSYTMKSVQTATLKKNKLTGEYEAMTKALMVYEGEEFYVSMESTNAKKGAEAFYNVQVNKAESVFFTKGDNSDDWENDGEVDTSLGSLKTGKISAQTLYTDWVGFGDPVDYKRIKVTQLTKLYITVVASDVGKFSVYSVNTSKNSLNTHLTAKLSKDKQTGNYTMVKEVVLQAGDYYFCMESTTANKGADVDYSVSVSGGSYNRAVNTDDSFETAKNLGTLSGEALKKHSRVLDSTDCWVGYDDEYDYKKIHLNKAARLSFLVTSDEATSFSVCQFDEKKNKLKSLQKVSLKSSGTNGCEVQTKELLLEEGDYYLCIQSTNARKYGYSDYAIQLSDSVFFSDGDDNSNDFLLDAKKKLNPGANSFQPNTVTKKQEILVDKQNVLSRKIDNVTYKNFVGFGDEADYAKLTLSNNGKLRFTVTATDAAKFTLYKLVPGKNETFSVKSLLSGKLAKGKNETVYSFRNEKGVQLLSGEVYYICVESANSKKSEYGAYYNVSVEYEQMQDVKEGKLASPLDMPDDSFAGSDGLDLAGAGDLFALQDGLRQYFADTFDLGAAGALDSLSNDTSDWQNITRLA